MSPNEIDSREDVRDPRAWLSTTVSRICLDRSGSPRAPREVYPGTWLPEPVRTVARLGQRWRSKLSLLMRARRRSTSACDYRMPTLKWGLSCGEISLGVSVGIANPGA